MTKIYQNHGFKDQTKSKVVRKMAKMYKVDNNGLINVQKRKLTNEQLLEDWIVEDPSIIGLEILIIGRQVATEFSGRIDILALDREGAIVILELKRDKTPRDTVAQILDYASWVTTLTPKNIHEISSSYLDSQLEDAFREYFGSSLPESLNYTHSMVIVASEFDASSRRIVEYLAEKHGISINTAFFDVFEENTQQFLVTNWLMDQQEVIERAERQKKARWTGYFYVNAGHDPEVRSWDDMREYGFIAAGYGKIYSKQLERLNVGDPIYVYQRECGYIGYGLVRSNSVESRNFRLTDGRSLNEVQLQQPEIMHHPDDAELTDYVVGVEWVMTVAIEDAMTFPNAFYNRHVVCKLRHPETLEFLAANFGNNI